MSVNVVVPPLGTTVDTLTLIAWYKQEGDFVQKDEPLFVVETDKATLDVESPASGILQKVSATAGDSVNALSRIAVILAEGESLTEAKPTLLVEKPVATPIQAPKPAPALEQRKLSLPRRIFISPRAKRLAETSQLAWQTIVGTGPEGAVVERDVRAALSKPQSAVTPITLTTETDATELVALQARLRQMGVTVSYDDLLLLILVRALREHPKMNASLEGNTVTHWEAVHIGMTLEVEEDLRLVVLRDADQKGLKALAQETNALKRNAEAGNISPDQSQGATFAITNLGTFGIDAFTPVIPLPACPLLGVGRIKQENAGDKATQRHNMWISLSFDPRLVRGVLGVRFLQCVAEYIETPTLALI